MSGNRLGRAIRLALTRARSVRFRVAVAFALDLVLGAFDPTQLGRLLFFTVWVSAFTLFPERTGAGVGAISLSIGAAGLTFALATGQQAPAALVPLVLALVGIPINVARATFGEDAGNRAPTPFEERVMRSLGASAARIRRAIEWMTSSRGVNSAFFVAGLLAGQMPERFGLLPVNVASSCVLASIIAPGPRRALAGATFLAAFAATTMHALLRGSPFGGSVPDSLALPCVVAIPGAFFTFFRAVGTDWPPPWENALPGLRDVSDGQGTAFRCRIDGFDVEAVRDPRARLTIGPAPRLAAGIDVALLRAAPGFVTGDPVFDARLAVRGAPVRAHALLAAPQREALLRFIRPDSSIRDGRVVVEDSVWVARRGWLRDQSKRGLDVAKVLASPGTLTDCLAQVARMDPLPSVRMACLASALLDGKACYLKPVDRVLRDLRRDALEGLRILGELHVRRLAPTPKKLLSALLDHPDSVVHAVVLLEAPVVHRDELLSVLRERAPLPHAANNEILARTIGRLGDARCEPLLLELRRDPSPRVRDAADEALRLLGGAAPDAGRLSIAPAADAGELSAGTEGGDLDAPREQAAE